MDNNGNGCARARQLLQSTLVWDNHACMPLRPDDESFLPQLDRFRAVGTDVVSLNVGYGPYGLEDHIRMFAAFRRWLRMQSSYALIEKVSDIENARAQGKLGIVFDIEGMVPLDKGDHGLVELFYDLGARWMLIAYNRNNAAGGGCHDDDTGLTAFGRQVLAEMKRVGMVVCCSHTGHRTVRDVMEHADNPVIFSHSNPAAVSAHPRNIPDDLIDACARTGGVVGVSGIGFFLGANDDRPETMAQHIDYLVQRIGPDHVGISLDYVFDQEDLIQELASKRDTFPDPQAYAGIPKMVPPEGLEAMFAALFARGYREADLAKIAGGNWRRVAEKVWR